MLTDITLQPRSTAAMHLRTSLMRNNRGRRYRSEVKTIWAVDDDRTDRLIVFQNLQRNFPGITVRCFATGAELLDAMAQGEPPSLVLLDIGLPDIDGLTVLKRLRLQLRERNAPVSHVIMLTGRDLEDVEAECREAGALTVLSKNACENDQSHLIASVEMILQLRRG